MKYTAHDGTEFTDADIERWATEAEEGFPNGLNLMPRIAIDPNQPSRKDPKLLVSSFEDADKLPEVGQKVMLVQEYDDEPNFVGIGKVHSIDDKYELIYIEPDWSSFHDERTYKKA